MTVKQAYDNYFTELYIRSFGFVKSKQDAEDIVLGLFAKMLEQQERFEKIEHSRAFLYRSVWNACINFNKYKPVPFDEKTMDEPVEFHDDYFQIEMDIIKSLQGDLTKQERRLLNNILSGMDTDEISKAMGKGSSTIRSIKRYLVAHLKQLIQPHKHLIH